MPDELRPVCFIAMPFREKKTAAVQKGAPSEVNFDALWDRAYRPAIEKSGYIAVRADLDTGSVIVKDMVERLAYADLVLADVSIPNGNVYYEVGLRHAARETGCILFAADWSKQLFDIEQFTSTRYPLTDGDVTSEDAEAIQNAVCDAIAAMKLSKTPWYEYVGSAAPQWPKGGQTVFREEAKKLSAFQADLRSIRLESDPDTRTDKLKNKLADLEGGAALRVPQAAVEMLQQVRDHLGWEETLKLIDRFDVTIKAISFIEEQRLLALAKTGETTTAIAHMEALIERFGETPERLGLIGGRYKQLWRKERDIRTADGGTAPSTKEKAHLNKAIGYYERGMVLNYNEYYCSCNIAPLLMARGRKVDLDRALIVDHFVVAACERAIQRDEDDEWTRPTLLGAAFRARDVDKARELAELVADEGPAKWNLITTLKDLDDILRLADNTPEQAELSGIREQLYALVD